MTNIILCGCNGKMGRVIAQCAENRQDCEIVGGIDVRNNDSVGFPVFTSAQEIDIQADTICVHGDGEHALEFVTKIRDRLSKEGVSISKLGG